MLTVALSLTAALFFGAADFCGGVAAKRTALFAVAVLSQGVGFVVLLAILPFFPGETTRLDYLWGALAGVAGGAGLALLYRALAIGKMGVVSPITAVLAASLPLGVGLFRGEHLSAMQICGVALALVAIALVSRSNEAGGSAGFSTAGLREAVFSGVLIGVFYVFISYSQAAAGLHGLLAARVASTLFLLLVAAVTRTDLAPKRATFGLIALGGALDMTANALYVLATFHGYLSIAAVLTSLYPASTVFLARAVLKERLNSVQKSGVALALASVGMIALRQ